jgi:hypothetical protein
MQQELSPARRIAINVLIMLAVFAVAVILAVTLYRGTLLATEAVFSAGAAASGDEYYCSVPSRYRLG